MTPPPAAGRSRFWFWAAGVLALVAAILAIIVLRYGTSVRGHVADTYTRAAELDRDEELAYTSTAEPSAVADSIVRKWRPVSQYADAGGIYLRYNDDMVLVRQRGKGSEIRVDDIDRAHRTYHSHVGGTWGWTSTHGESFRGRGPGAGK